MRSSLPTTLDATLMCQRCRRPTLHLFHEKRPQRKDGRGPAYVDLIYVCDDCETERIWGSEPKPRAGKEAAATEALMEHAIAVHGMRLEDCPACRGVGLACSECGDHGQVWVFDSLDPCGPDCVLVAGLEP